jgi:hypothetical protein
MKGIRSWKNSHNKFYVVRVHYSADPVKDPSTSKGKKWYEQAHAGMSSNAWDREMEINFSIYSGQGVFSKDFTQNHIKKLKYMPDRILHRGWDFGRRRPAVVFSQIDLKGCWCIYKSILGQDVSIDEFARQVIIATNEWFPDVTEVRDYGDPAGNQVKDTSEKTTIQILKEYKIYVRTKRSTPLQRIEIIFKKLITLIEGEPSLLVDESCHNIIEGFQGGYHYPKSKEGKGVKENPADDGYYIHLFDALGYTADHLFSLSGQEREKKGKVIKAINWGKR